MVTKAIRSQDLFGLGGPMVTKFEQRFAALYGAKYAVASTSGTAAIHIAIGTINPEPGDEVITAPITDGGSIVPILYQNAIPVFADVDTTYNMDPQDVERKITPRTKAILVVHLFGNPCNMDAMLEIARRHKVWLLEDCCQAHLTEYKGRLLGTIGDMGCFSLQRSKHITTGDGGMTITNNDSLSERMMLFRDKGWTRKPGWGARTYAFLAPNYRMTELQGAVGVVQTEKVRSVVTKRNELGDLLSSLIRGLPGVQPAPVTSGGRHTYWIYPLRVTEGSAEVFARALCAEGIPAEAHYIGEPIFLCMEALANKVTFGSSQHPLDGCHGGRQLEYTHGICPQTEQALRELVTLSIHEGMSREDVEDIAAAIRKVAYGLTEKALG
ncbi:MAG: DegT/DnrJ/EryC1/StrS family aminotransferase [Armatimonadetes bacterium]|nr:DegT/DnrJ/EryC1/StrS family aminotransferase [Armatimonadota bacterium]